MLLLTRWFAVLVLCLAFVGCDDPKPREKVPPVHYYSDVWRESANANLHDGALRVGAYTFQEGRRVTVRCYGPPNKDTRTLDIRYTIEVPLLRRLEKELKEKGDITLNVSADGNVSRILKAQVGTSNDSLFFLADADRELVESLANAKKKVFVVPVLNGEKIDGALDFGAAYAKEHINKVLDACKASEAPAVKSEPTESKRAGK
jgi:hypothetical protein